MSADTEPSPMRIGERLVTEGLLSTEAVADGLHAHVVQGARIGTNLVERGHIQLDALAQALGRHHNMPPALQKHFDGCDPQTQQRLDPKLAALWRALPLGFVAPNKLALAVTDPLPEPGIAAISKVYQCEIVPAIAPELRVLYHLEKVYGIRRPARYLRVKSEDGRPDDKGAEGAEKRKYAAQINDSSTSPQNQLGRIAIRKRAAGLDEAAGAPMESLQLALKQLRRAPGRDSLGSALDQILVQHFGPPVQVVIVYVQRERVAAGWIGALGGESCSHFVDDLVIPLDRPSAIALPMAESQGSHGPPTSTQIDKQLWRAFGTEAPGWVGVVPICVAGRSVGAIYAQAIEPPGTETFENMDQLGQVLGRAFERLVQASQR